MIAGIGGRVMMHDGGGRVRSVAGVVIVLVVVGLVCSAPGSGPSAEAAPSPAPVAAPVVAAGSVCLVDLTPAGLDTLFDTEPGGVIGADYQRATTMPDGRVLWTFQDAAVRVAERILIVHNIAVVQDGSCFTVLYNGSRSDPKPMFFPTRTSPFERWFWPLDAVAGDDGRMYVFAAEMEERGDKYLTRTVPVGTWVAVFDPAADVVVDELRPPDASAELYGWSITSDDSWTYLYAHCYRQFGFDQYAFVAAFDRSCSRDITVARVPRGMLFSSPTYWDGTSWQLDPARARSVVPRDGRRVNADQFEWTGAGFVSVNKEGDWWGDTILLSQSADPTGPFEVYDRIRAPVKCDVCNTFFATWVPSAAVGRTDRTFVVSLAHNRWDGRITSLYRPTFDRVAAPRFLPAGRTFSFDVGVDASTAVLNVVAVEPLAAGYLTVFPCDRGLPIASNVNHAGEPLVSNLVLARPDGDGRICVFSRATTDVVVDLAGTFARSSGFVPADTPLRLTDTREPVGGSPVEAGGVLRVPLPPGFPAGVAVVNVVAVGHESPGYLTVFPCDRSRPATSNVNYVTEPIVSNLVVTPTGDVGEICVFSSARTDVVVDLAGAFPTIADGPTLEAIDAVRLVDTRDQSPERRLGAGSTLAVDLGADAAGAPAVAVNLIAIEPGSAGYLTVHPCDLPRPTTSNLNYVNAPIVSNLVLARPSADGRVCVFTSAEVDIVVDLAGRLTGSSGYVPLDRPFRMVDTRTGRGVSGQLGTPVFVPR